MRWRLATFVALSGCASTTPAPMVAAVPPPAVSVVTSPVASPPHTVSTPEAAQFRPVEPQPWWASALY